MAEYHEDFIDIQLESGSVARTFIHQALGGGDNKANRFGVRAYRGNAEETLSGSVFGYFIRADGNTVIISDGAVSGNEAYVTLPKSCYAIEGNFTLAIKISNNGGMSTLRIVDGTVARTSTDATEDPGDLIVNIDELLEALAEATEGADNIANKMVRKPVDDPDGTYGQALITNGDGTTEWKTQGQPTDAQVEAAIDAWLSAHPEATTTVQDGSISRAKLATAVGKAIDWSQSVRFYFPNLSAGSYSGSCALVTVGSEAMLFDASKSEDWTLIRDWLDGLQTDGVFSNIDYIFISHYHSDHIGCLENILGRYPHANCDAYIAPTIEGHAAELEYLVTNYANVVSILSTAGVTTHVVTADTTVQTDTDFVDIELFNTSTADYLYYDGLYAGGTAIYNNYSMMALVRCGNVHAMFPGDIQRDAQIRVMDTRGTLPRLFLYAVHHHGIQNDDYTPYLDEIDPQYSVISTSHSRALVSAASSYSGNYLSGQTGSTGFDEYVYVCDKDAGQIIKGRDIPKIGWAYNYVDLYVDNSYSGAIHDGTEEHPYTEINEAIMFVSQNGNLHYRIRVKGTATKYAYMWIRDYYVPIEIIGYKDANGANVFPSVHGGYIRTCNYISVSNICFDGDGRDQYTYHPMLFIWASTVYLNGCVLDGANVPDTVTQSIIGIYIQETRTIYLTGCTFQNMVNGIRSYRYGGIICNSITFKNISSSGYNLGNLEVRLRAADDISNIGTGVWMLSVASGGATPFIVDAGCITSALAAGISKYAASAPFYANDSHPCCMVSKQKIYDLLTGSEVTI